MQPIGVINNLQPQSNPWISWKSQLSSHGFVFLATSSHLEDIQESPHYNLIERKFKGT